mgnify:CR=1 FL=1
MMIETRHTVRVVETTPQVARETIEVSPAGYGLHWPLVDEDLSIDGILRNFSERP